MKRLQIVCFQTDEVLVCVSPGGGCLILAHGNPLHLKQSFALTSPVGPEEQPSIYSPLPVQLPVEGFHQNPCRPVVAEIWKKEIEMHKCGFTMSDGWDFKHQLNVVWPMEQGVHTKLVRVAYQNNLFSEKKVRILRGKKVSDHCHLYVWECSSLCANTLKNQTHLPPLDMGVCCETFTGKTNTHSSVTRLSGIRWGL